MSSLPANKIVANKKKGFQNKTLDLLDAFCFYTSIPVRNKHYEAT